MHAAATIAFADPWQTSIGTPFSLKLNHTKIMSRSQGINCFEFGCISAKLKTAVEQTGTKFRKMLPDGATQRTLHLFLASAMQPNNVQQPPFVVLIICKYTIEGLATDCKVNN